MSMNIINPLPVSKIAEISDQIFTCFWASRYDRCSCHTTLITFDDLFDHMFTCVYYRAYKRVLYTQQIRNIERMLVNGWVCVAAGGPTLSHHWFNVLCFFEYALLCTVLGTPHPHILKNTLSTRIYWGLHRPVVQYTTANECNWGPRLKC